MSSDEIAIRVSNLSKRFEIYDAPRDRLKQFVMPRLQRLAGQAPKQYFREFWALNDVSFEVRKGETIGIIGRNGSGKSTLLQMICGTLNPTSGTIQTRGRIAALLELGSGFNPEFTGRENIYMNASVLGLSKAEIDARYDDIAEFAEIGDFLDQPVKTYSSGMYVRLAFAVIAHVDADILIIDEALAVGDALFTQKCMRFIRKFSQTGSLVFVSHDTASVIGLCDRVVWLDGGCVRDAGMAKSVCESYLNALFGKHGNIEIDGNDSGSRERMIIRKIGDSHATERDQRASFINASPLRNDIEVFNFTPTEGNFGGHDAEICNVQILDSNGWPLSWVVGGELVTLRIDAIFNTPASQPIFGFAVKDRLGQPVFGDNTFISFLDRDNSVATGARVSAEFEFVMPWLLAGDYSIQAALADGTQDKHRQLHWIHDALIFRAHTSPVSTGFIGIPMRDIRMYETMQ